MNAAAPDGERALIALFNAVYEQEWDRAADESDDRKKALMGAVDEHATRMAIRAVVAAAAAPDGAQEKMTTSVFAPVEPTFDMIERGVYAQEPNMGACRGGSNSINRLRRRARRVYEAMTRNLPKVEQHGKEVTISSPGTTQGETVEISPRTQAQPRQEGARAELVAPPSQDAEDAARVDAGIPRSAAEIEEAFPDSIIGRACRRFEQCAAAELSLDECMEAAITATGLLKDAARYRELKAHFKPEFARSTSDYWVLSGELQTPMCVYNEYGDVRLNIDDMLDAARAAGGGWS